MSGCNVERKIVSSPFKRGQGKESQKSENGSCGGECQSNKRIKLEIGWRCW